MSAPRVRVVVVDYDGGDLTLECLRSLVATDWPPGALEVVLVDNASPHPIVGRVAEELPSVSIVRAGANRGFGAGCNLALHDLDGLDHVALVNNDVVVPSGWLGPLVEALEADATIGAACPKILLRDRYREVLVESESARRRLDPRPRGVRLSGLRIGGRDCWSRARCRAGFWGPEYRAGEPVGYWTGNGPAASLLVPDLPGGVELLVAADRPVRAALRAGDAVTTVDVGPAPTWHAIEPGGPAFDVIHNVGTDLVADGYGADRGYLETDHGQRDEPTDVFAWCGAAVLLSARYLRDVGLFDEGLFLYYEDLDLAWRGRGRGWRYRTVPGSVVRHVHSAAASRDALRTAELNERNHLRVLARHGTRTETARALWHHLLATGSYARRDLAAPLLRGERPNPATVTLRLRALRPTPRR